MKTRISSLLLLGCLSLWGYGSGRISRPPTAAPQAQAAPPPPAPVQVKPSSARELVIFEAAKEIGVVELTGNNDGKQVEAYLASVGLAKGNPYCAAFIYYVGNRALGKANPYPRSGWSPDQVDNPTWTASSGGQEPRAGDVGGIYFPDKGRIAHCFFVAGPQGNNGKWYAPKGFVRTIEANTSPTAEFGSAADRDAGANGCVCSKLRPMKSIRQVWSPRI